MPAQPDTGLGLLELSGDEGHRRFLLLEQLLSVQRLGIAQGDVEPGPCPAWPPLPARPASPALPLLDAVADVHIQALDVAHNPRLQAGRSNGSMTAGNCLTAWHGGSSSEDPPRGGVACRDGGQQERGEAPAGMRNNTDFPPLTLMISPSELMPQPLPAQ